MKTIQATEAKNRFGQLLEEAQRAPVAIQKNGRDVAVLISKAEYEAVHRDRVTHKLVQKYHEESIEKYADLYAELAK